MELLDELARLSQRASTTSAYGAVGPLSLDTLARLAVTEKAAVRAEPEAFVTQLGREARLLFTSSGTTGAPLVVRRTRAECRDNANAVAQRVAPLIGDGPHLIVSLVDHNHFAVGVLVEGIAEVLDAALFRGFPYGAQGLDAQGLLRAMRNFQPTVVIAAPGTAIDVEDAWGRGGHVEEAVASVKSLLMLGSALSTGLSARLSLSWGAAALNMSYGSSETATMATGCPAGLLHTLDERYILELRDDNGELRPLAVGGRGELITTPLFTEGIVLLRYATGDIVETQECSCGVPGTALRVAGREDDVVQGPKGPMGPEEIEALVFSFPEVQDYMLEIDEHDRLRVLRLQLFPGCAMPDTTSLQSTLECKTVLVESIPTLARSGALVKSWKRTRTVHRREGS